MIAFRTPPLRMEPAELHVGNSVQFAESKRWWRVRALADRFVILTSPFNLQRTVIYSIIDWERGVRGPDDHYGVGYETEQEIADALARLVSGEIEVSHRAHSIRVEIAAVKSRTAASS